MFEFKNKTILILSPEDWGKNLLSKHLYAKELSKKNQVYFLHTSPHPNQNSFIKSEQIEDSLTLIHLKKVVKGIHKLPSFAIDLQNKLIINKVNFFINQPIDVVWSFDQSKFQNLKQFDTKVSIFHPVDYIEKAQPFTSKIANSSNITLSVSHKILNEIKTSTQKHFINHGLDDIFATHANKTNTPLFIDKSKPNVAYVGNLQIKLMDWEALFNTVELNSNINFVFIGPDSESNIGGNKKFKVLDEIKKLPNTHFTGAMTKTELKNILHFFDAFLISYDHKKFPIHVSNSHKILEYLSTGKVVVSNYIDSYKDKNVIEMVTDNKNLPNKLKEVCNNLTEYNNPEKQQERINFATDNTYQKQITRIENLLNNC